MQRVTLFLGDRQYEELLALAAHLGRPYSELVREAVDDWLRGRAPAPPLKTTKTGRKRAVTRKRP